MSDLRIGLFQSLQISAGGRPLTDLGYPRQHNAALLTYLLLHRGQALQRTRLAFVLWPDVPESEAVANLRRSLHALKRALPAPAEPAQDYIQADRQTILWNTKSDYWLDVEEFESLSEPGPLAALTQAADLYGGDLLEDSYTDWLIPERERLRGRFIAVLEQLVTLQGQRRQYAAAIARAQQLLALDPLHEKIHQQLMALLFLTGDRTGALRQYDKCVTTLRAELAVPPLEETQALRERIQRGESLDDFFETDASSQVLSAPHPATGPGGFVSPVVGREAERSRLRELWQSAQAGSGSVIFVQGEAGIGKTRLVSDLLEHLRGSAFVLTGAGHASEQLLPYQPLAEALRSADLTGFLKNADEGSDSGWWLAEVALLVPELREQQPRLPVMAVPDAGQARLRLFQGLTRCLLGLAEQKPVLLLLDDLHWADEETLSWLEYAARQIRLARLFIVATYRSEEETAILRQIKLALAHEGVLQELRLSRLTAESVGQLLQSLSGSGDTTGEFSQRLYRETEGNPLFIIETLRALIEAGVLQRDSQGRLGNWQQLASEPGNLILPASIRDAIRSRLRQLSETTQQVLEAASAVGRNFDDRLVAQASGRTEEEVVSAIEEALQTQVVAESGPDYHFTHDKIQEVLYGSLTPGRRRLLHRRIAESLEGRQGARPEAAGPLAYHFERAEAWEKAAGYARSAAEQAKRTYASVEALAYYDLALTSLARLSKQLVEPDELKLVRGQRFDVLSQEHGIWTLLGQFDRTQTALEEMVQLARENADESRLSDALNGLAYHWMNMGQPALARAPLEEALAIKRQINDHFGQLDSLITLGTVCIILGEVAAGLAVLNESRALSLSLADDNALARSEWATGASIYEGLGDYEQAMAHLQPALELSRKSGNRALECGSLLMLGAASTRLGDYETSGSYLNAVLEIARQIGDRPSEGWGLLYFSWVERERGELETSLERGTQAREIGREMQADFLSWYAGHSLARVYLLLGRASAALEAINEANQINRKRTLHPSVPARTLATLARVYLELGNIQMAGNSAKEALLELQSLRVESLPELQGAYFDCYLVLQRSGAEVAQTILEKAYSAMNNQAAAIQEPHRRARFLQGVLINREIRAAYQAAHQATQRAQP